MLTDIGNAIFSDRYAAPGETTPAHMIDRVAKAIAHKEDDRDRWTREFTWLMEDWRFVPAGRILSGAGAVGDKTLYNCYVLPSPHDSRGGIMDTLRQMAEIMSRGGGVGLNLSSLRPSGAKVVGVNGKSNGAVSWGGLYSYTTGLISQGGSRRGALMLVLEDWHPDILEFINIKRNNGKMTNANLSVGVSDEFMVALERGESWSLVFPDTTHAAYDKEWTGDLKEWQDKGYPVKCYATIPARDLWQAIADSAWACAEPGVWFCGRARELSNSSYYNHIVGVNPCGEEPLPAWGVCNLGSLNLSAFHDASLDNVNWIELRRAVRAGVRFLDNVIEVTPYYFRENERQQLRERRLGLGTMGLADLLIKQKLVYGSPEAVRFTDRLYRFIAIEAYEASIDLAIERGSFPAFDADQFVKGGFVKTLPVDLRAKIARFGLRNVTLLTAAPTGTTGTMIDVSTGIEPHYALEYERDTRFGKHTQRVPLYDEWRAANNGAAIPDYFVTSMDIAPAAHIAMQAAVQRWVDAAVSKTINLPNRAPPDDVRLAYEDMYYSGTIKGGTVYRDGCRVQVLNKCADGECVVPG